MPTDKPYSIKTLKDFFGVRDGETIRDFASEIKACSEEELTQLAKGIEDGTLNY